MFKSKLSRKPIYPRSRKVLYAYTYNNCIGGFIIKTYRSEGARKIVLDCLQTASITFKDAFKGQIFFKGLNKRRIFSNVEIHCGDLYRSVYDDPKHPMFNRNSITLLPAQHHFCWAALQCWNLIFFTEIAEEWNFLCHFNRFANRVIGHPQQLKDHTLGRYVLVVRQRVHNATHICSRTQELVYDLHFVAAERVKAGSRTASSEKTTTF